MSPIGPPEPVEQAGVVALFHDNSARRTLRQPASAFGPAPTHGGARH